MDKELLEMLKELNENLDKLVENNKNTLKNKIYEKIEKAYKEKAKLSIEKFEDGEADISIEGSSVSLLIALAGLEKAVFEKLNPPKGFWELIKVSVGIKEGKK